MKITPEMIEAGAKAIHDQRRAIKALGSISWNYAEWDQCTDSWKEADRQTAKMILEAAVGRV